MKLCAIQKKKSVFRVNGMFMGQVKLHISLKKISFGQIAGIREELETTCK